MVSNKAMRLIKPILLAMVQALLMFAALVWLLDSGAKAMGYQWQWHRVPDYILFLKMANGGPLNYCKVLWSRCSSLPSAFFSPCYWG